SAGLFGVDSPDVAGLAPIPTSGIGATMGTHVGPGAIGVAFFTKRLGRAGVEGAARGGVHSYQRGPQYGAGDVDF
ncbi:MAG: DegV family protein, partial [Coriobacteriaceae bacterium]|nr:DegV family protein [Coriobacteriaceae bacterium]